MSSPEVSILKYFEEGLLLCLVCLDLMELCLELRKHMLISREVKDSFDLLDQDSSDASTKTRYLFQLVCDKIGEDKECFDNFLTVLVELGLKDRGDSLKEMLCQWESSNEIVPGGTSECSRKRKLVGIGGRILRENEVPILTEVLMECSHKWEEIGMCLRLKTHEIKECGEASSYSLKLSRILTKWLDTAHSIPSTLDNLCEVLNNRILDMPNLANGLVNNFIAKLPENVWEKPKKFCRPIPLRLTYQSTDTEIANGKAALLEVRVECSESVKYQWKKDGQKIEKGCHFSYANGPFLFITSGKLAVEGNYSCTIISDNNEKIESNSINLTVIFPMITQYFLKIYSKLDELPKGSWPPVTTTSFINLALITKKKDKTHLYDYTVQGDMDDIIESKDKIEYEELFGNYESGTLLLVEGRPGSGKTTLMHKVTRDWSLKKDILIGAKLVILIPLRLFSSFNDNLSLSDIIKYYVSGADKVQEILSHIEDSMGEGVCFIIDGLDEYQQRDVKSNTIYKLMHKVLFRLSMVVVASRPIGSAKLRVKGQINKRVEVLGFSKQDIFSYVNEYNFNDAQIIFNLKEYLKLHERVLHMCYLPVHAAMICYLYSEMGGGIPQTETKMYESFTLLSIKRRLMRDDNILCSSFSSIAELNADVRTSFYNICELAFEMIVSSKQAIHQKDTEILLSSTESNSASFGLVTIDSAAKMLGFEEFYTYLHLTFQEYLASVHLTTLNNDELVKVIDLYITKPEFFMLWRFLCGSIDFSNKSCVLEKLLSSTTMGIMNKVLCGFESQQQKVCDYILQSGSLSFKDHSFVTSDFVAISQVITNCSYFITRLEFVECSMQDEGIKLLLKNLTPKHFSKVIYLGYHKKNCTASQFKVLNQLLQNLISLQHFNLEKTDLSRKGIIELTRGVSLPSLNFLQLEVPLKASVCDFKILNQMKFKSNCLSKVQFACDGHKRNAVEKIRSSYQVLYGVFQKCLCWNPEYPMINNLSGHIRLSDFSNCSSLILVNCGLDDLHMEYIVQCLVTYKKLKELKLDFNQITGSGAKLLASSFETCTSLEVFSAHCNRIDDSGALALAKKFVHLNRFVRVLDLQCNAISEEGVHEVTEVTEAISSSTDFNLFITVNTIGFACSKQSSTNTQLVQNSIESIWKGSSLAKGNALKCCSFVPEIHINGRHNSIINFEWTHGDLETLVEGLMFCKNTVELVLANDKIGASTIEALAAALKSCTGIHTLDLHSNNIGSFGAKALAAALKSCIGIHTLDLDNNNIGSSGAEALAAALKSCAGIHTLDLASNNIGSSGGEALAAALKSCTGIHTLYFDGNSIGSSGAKALAAALKSCTGIHTLNLESNNIGSSGAEALATALESCTGIHTLGHANNNIGSSGAEALAAALKRCTGIHTLDLDSNNIGSSGAEALAAALKSCTGIHTLDLASNNIGSSGAEALAAALKRCTGIHTLDLRRNNIDSSGAEALAAALKSCTGIHTLDLGSNNIDSSGAEALAAALKSCTDIHTLNLEGNNIISSGAEALSAALKRCTGIHTLDLRRNNIDSSGAEALAAALKSCTDIHTLDLANNNIGSSGAEALAAALKSCTDIHTLNLEGNNIGSSGAEALAAALKRCTGIHTLDLRRNNIDSSGAEALAAALKSCTGIHTLDLGSNNIDSSGAEALAAALKSCTGIHTLYFDGNNICSCGAEALAAALKSCTGIHTLDLDGNNIGSYGAEALAAALKSCTGIHTLDLRRNNIDSSGAEALATALKSCTGIHTLDLYSNNISSSGAEALAAALKSCTDIHTLDLDSNNIGSYGAEALAAVLKSCTGIHTLDLDNNNIGSSGAKALAAALKSCTSIHTLYLINNNIGLSGAEALAAALKSCTGIHTLYLTNNSIGSSGASTLAAALKSCTGIHTLSLSGNNIDSAGAEALAAALKSCTGIHTLGLGNNNIGSSGAEALAAALKSCTCIHTLNLYCNNIGSSGAEALAAALKSCTGIHALNLGNNNIGSSGAEVLAAALKSCTGIHTLGLANNNIGSSGAEAVAAALKSCTGIHTLYLASNNIGSSGAEVLAAALKTCTGIHALFLGNNNIGSSGTEVLAAALKSCTGIHALDLGNNNIGSSGAEVLAAALKSCTGIHTLGLANNNFGSSGAEALAAALKNCTGIHTLGLANNNIGSSGAEALAAALMSCTGIHTLGLAINNIGSTGAAEALAAALKSCTGIHTLYLANNNIGSSGAEALAAALKSCTGIHTLDLGNNNIGSSGAEALVTALRAVPVLIL